MKLRFSRLVLAAILVSSLGLARPPGGNGEQEEPVKCLDSCRRFADTDTETTKSGHVFIRDKSHPKLGEAWRDESGTVWGDVVRNEDGSVKEMTHVDADAYCKSIGAELPSGYPEKYNGDNGFPNRDSDFTRLRKHLGGVLVPRFKFPQGYRAQVLPGLEQDLKFWSSSFNPRLPHDAYFLHGGSGTIDFAYVLRGYAIAVRCVVRVP